MTRLNRPPLSPEAAAIVRAQLTRRSALAGAGALGVGGMLAACGTGDDGTGSAAPKAAIDKSDIDHTVNWANWALYLDVTDDGKHYKTLEAFEKKTGIKATYAEDIDDNSSYYGKISGQLKNGADIGQDIVVFTDWMAAQIKRLGYAQKLDGAAIPNKQNLAKGFQNVDYDKNRDYTLPWQGGFTGVAWNKEKVPGGIHNITDLWKPEFKGRVEVLSEFRDTIGLVMLSQGVDPHGNFTDTQFENAVAEVQKQVSSGQVRQVKGNSYTEDLKSKDALVVIAWSGDITTINADEGNKWQFAIPESGGMQWADNMLVPIGSPHKKNAETLMNYYYDPKVAAQVAAYVNYICPVEGAQKEMEKLDPELVHNDLIFPSEEYLKNVHHFRTLTPQEQTKYNSSFESVLGN